jgi:NADH:ubiquinone oxidoreductase subunit C
MTQEELKLRLSEIHPPFTFDEGTELVTARLEPGNWKDVAQLLLNHNDLQFDFMVFITCVDWKTNLGMVYCLRSSAHGHNLIIKIQIDREQPEIETVSDLWRTAEFHEREVYDLFGVRFINHPDLRRLFLTEDWQGWPLRKDYEDDINMIKL